MDRFPGSVAFAREILPIRRVTGDGEGYREMAEPRYYRQSVGVKVTTQPETVRLSPRHLAGDFDQKFQTRPLRPKAPERVPPSRAA